MSLSAVLLIHISSLGGSDDSDSGSDSGGRGRGSQHAAQTSSNNDNDNDEHEQPAPAVVASCQQPDDVAAERTNEREEDGNDDDVDDETDQDDETDDDDQEEEEEEEYYHVLELPKYASLPEIRKAHRRISQRLACERMSLSLLTDQQQQQQQQQQAAPFTAKEMRRMIKMLDQFALREKKAKHAYAVLGDAHLRQQYHLLQCQPRRYRVIHGTRSPLQFIQNWTRPGRWMPLLVLQSVLMYVALRCVALTVFIVAYTHSSHLVCLLYNNS
jgi:hypothetical protein